MSELDSLIESGNEELATPEDAKVETEAAPETDNANQAGEAKSEAETTSADSDESWTKAMALDERRKRQLVERENEELKLKLSDQDQRPSTPDPIEDPEGAINHLNDDFETKLLNQKIEMSQAFMRDKHEDYDEVEKQFYDMAQKDPSLWPKLRASELPAKFAYNHVKAEQKRSELEGFDMDKWKEEERERIKQELQGNKDSDKQEDKATKTEVPSLANVGTSGNEAITEKALEDIFPT